MAHADLASASSRGGAVDGILRVFSRARFGTRAGAARFLFSLVPALIVVFIITLFVAMLVQARAAREEEITAASDALETLARALAHEIPAPPHVVGSFGGAATVELPPSDRLGARGRRVFVADGEGRIAGAHPPFEAGARTLTEILGDAQALTTFGDRAGVIDRKSTRLNSSHIPLSRMPSSA